MDDLIRTKIHEAFDVVSPEGDLRSRVMSSLPADDLPRNGQGSSPTHWSAGVVAVLLAIAVVAGLLYINGALSPRGGSSRKSQATNPLASNLGPVGTITVYPAPTNLANVGGLTFGPDGSLWFTAVGTSGAGNLIVRLNPNGSFSDYSVPSQFSGLGGITAGPDGSIWFTETGGATGVVATGARRGNIGKVGKITPTGVITEYSVPASETFLVGIATGPDHDLWVTDRAANKVYRVTVSGTVDAAFAIPTANSEPTSITVGPDGSLWLTESYAGKVARLTTAGAFTEFSLPNTSDVPVSIVAGPDGNLWVTESGRFGSGGPGKVAKVTTSGAFTEYTVPNLVGPAHFEEPPPGRIIVGPDKNLWFGAGDNLDMVTTSGVFTQYVIPGTGSSATYLRGIAAGPDGSIWFTAGGQPGLHAQVGRLVAVTSKP